MIDVDGLLNRGLRSDCRVGIGLPEKATDNIRRRLARSHSGVCPVSYSSTESLISSLKDGDIDAAVRGSLSSVKVLEFMKTAFSLDAVMRTAILEDVRGKQFLLTPVGIDEGTDRDSRLTLAEKTYAYFSRIGWNLQIGVLSKGRLEDGDRTKEVKASLRDGEWLVGRLRRQGFRAAHYAILLEDAVAKSDLVVAPDGITGNLIFRSMHFVGGGKAFGAPVVNIKRVFVDTSRAKSEFTDSVLLAAGLAQKMAGHRGSR